MLNTKEKSVSDKRRLFAEPFIESTKNTVQMMGNTQVSLLGEDASKSDIAWSDVISGLIGFAGEKLTGSMALRFDEPSILSIVSGMFMEEFKELTPEVVDAVGEMTNIILGHAKRGLYELGYQFEMAQPTVIEGKDLYLHQMSDTAPTLVKFSVPKGIFVLELSFKFPE